MSDIINPVTVTTIPGLNLQLFKSPHVRHSDNVQYTEETFKGGSHKKKDKKKSSFLIALLIVLLIIIIIIILSAKSKKRAKIRK